MGDSVATLRSEIEEQTECEIDRIVFGTAQLSTEDSVSAAGLESECTVHALVDAEGGKRKRKKKVHTTPKKIKHTHKKRKQESPRCPPGTYMAEHPDRFVCGKTGQTYFKMTNDGKRLPIPKNNRPAKPTVIPLAAKAAAKGGKEKK